MAAWFNSWGIRYMNSASNATLKDKDTRSSPNKSHKPSPPPQEETKNPTELRPFLFKWDILKTMIYGIGENKALFSSVSGYCLKSILPKTFFTLFNLLEVECQFESVTHQVQNREEVVAVTPGIQSCEVLGPLPLWASHKTGEFSVLWRRCSA